MNPNSDYIILFRSSIPLAKLFAMKFTRETFFGHPLNQVIIKSYGLSEVEERWQLLTSGYDHLSKNIQNPSLEMKQSIIDHHDLLLLYLFPESSQCINVEEILNKEPVKEQVEVVNEPTFVVDQPKKYGFNKGTKIIV